MQTKTSLRGAPWAIARAAGAATTTGLAAAAGWTAYSTLFVNHKQHVPPAIQANKYVIATPRSGRLSFYADEGVNGRPLILIHSVNAAASAYEMLPLFEYYRKQRPVFALDLPGFGFSERADRRYTPNVYVQAILDLVDGELDGSEPVDLIALSLSCEFAAVAASEHPSAFRSLTMIAPSGFSSSTRQPSEYFYRAISFPLWGQAFYDLLVTPASIRYFLQKVFSGPVDEGLAEYDYLTAHRPGARHAPLAFVAGNLFTPDIRSVYSALPQPVLAFCNQSEFGPSDLLPGFVERHVRWRMRCLEGTKAMPHFERTKGTLAEIDAFFASELA